MLKPGGYVAFSTWQLGVKHQISQLVGATMEHVTPGAAQPRHAQDLTQPEPVLTLLQESGFQDIHHR